MKDIFFQKVNGLPVPFSAEDKEAYASFKENQITRHKVSGITKARSLTQIRTFFACCDFVATNVIEYDLGHPKFEDGSHWNTKDKVAFMIKVALHFVDDSKTIVYKNQIHFHYRSIGFKNLKHLGACFFFDRAFPLLAGRIGMEQDDMINEAKSLMGR